MLKLIRYKELIKLEKSEQYEKVCLYTCIKHINKYRAHISLTKIVQDSDLE